VYHGSYCEIENPDLKYSRGNLDFGKGFYVTGLREQAINWAKLIKIRSNKDNCFLNIYRLDIEKLKDNYKVKEFDNYSLEWLDFIIDCRSGSDIYTNYDVVIGGIADDRVFNTLDLYINGLIKKSEALNRLKYYKPNNQICIISNSVIKNELKFIKSEEI
ncbi:MAG: DUF3990 domain-containing protein, partial [Clostridia bacterium]